MVLNNDDIRKLVADRREWAVETLSSLVRHPTVLDQEEPGQEELAGVMEELGLAVRFEPMARADIADLPGFSPVDWKLEGKRNLVGIHQPSAAGGRSLAFNGHIDVVSPEPVKLWTSPPYEPRLQSAGEDGEDWVFGRGTGDMKGGTVSYLWALAALRDAGLEPAGRVLCQSPVEEECTGNGTLALLAKGYLADACIIPEPFGETVMTHQVGVVWFRVRVLGRTTHVLGAGSGVNAIEKSIPLIEALRQMEFEANRPDRAPRAYRDVPHPLNLNVGVMQGGDWASTVAGECVIQFRFALFPGESLTALRQRVESVVTEVARGDAWLEQFPPAVEWVGFQAEGCKSTLDGDFGAELRRSHSSFRGAPPSEISATATTDVRFFELYHGTPATCYGPRAADIHGVDERVSLDSMTRVAEVLAGFVRNWCGLRKRR